MLKDAGYCNERGEPFNPAVGSSNDRGTAAAAAATVVTHRSFFGLLPIPEVKQTKK
jgi:hypothetical protein